MHYKIITDEKALNLPCADVSLKEGRDIASILFGILQTTKNSIGLAANQIGINKAVCVVCSDSRTLKRFLLS